MESIDLKNVSHNPSNPRATSVIESALVRRADNGQDLTIIAGARRLQAALAVHGQAEVKNADTGEVLQVREVDGSLVAV